MPQCQYSNDLKQSVNEVLFSIDNCNIVFKTDSHVSLLKKIKYYKNLISILSTPSPQID